MSGDRRPGGLDRRAIVLGAACLGLAACVPDEKPAPRVARFRAVEIDTSPFAAKGVTNYAAVVAAYLRAAAAERFADLLAPGDPAAPVMVIEVSTVRIASYSGGPSHGGTDFGDSGDGTDEMAGALVLRSVKGAPIDRRRHFATTDAASAGDWRLPDNEERRLRALCRLYVEWAAREYR